MALIANYRSLGHFFDTSFDTYFQQIYLDQVDWEQKPLTVKDLLPKFKEIAQHVEKLGLFSSNEDLEELNTNQIKFMLVPFILGDLNKEDMDMNSRLESLKNALVNYRFFMSRAMVYKLGNNEDIAAYTRGSEVKLSPAEARTDKIERQKRISSLNNKVSALRKRIARFAEEDTEDDGIVGVDEEIHRALMLSLVDVCIAKVLSESAMIESEIPMLEEMEKRKTELPAQQQLREAMEEAHRETQKNKKPFMLQIKDPSEIRKLYQERVLQPFIELPTVTLAEIGEREMIMETEILTRKNEGQFEMPDNLVVTPWIDRGENIVEDYSEQRVADVVKRGNARVIKDDPAEHEDKRKREYDLLDEDFEAREDKDYEERAWDDWKDENPRGAGNKMVNRG